MAQWSGRGHLGLEHPARLRTRWWEGWLTVLGAGKRKGAPRRHGERKDGLMQRKEAEESSGVRNCPWGWVRGRPQAWWVVWASRCSQRGTTAGGKDEEGKKLGTDFVSLREPREEGKGFLWNEIKEVQRQTKKWLITIKDESRYPSYATWYPFKTRSTELGC